LSSKRVGSVQRKKASSYPKRLCKVVTVREAKVSDSKRIAQLSTQLGYPISAQIMAKLVEKAMKRKDQMLFTAELCGNVIGWLEIFRPLSVLNSGKAEIGALVVDSQIHRLGVGTALMNEAQKWARQSGSPFIYLRSNIVRKGAHDFYLRNGYSVLKTQYVFQKTLQHRKPRIAERKKP